MDVYGGKNLGSKLQVTGFYLTCDHGCLPHIELWPNMGLFSTQGKKSAIRAFCFTWSFGQSYFFAHHVTLPGASIKYRALYNLV